MAANSNNPRLKLRTGSSRTNGKTTGVRPLQQEATLHGQKHLLVEYPGELKVNFGEEYLGTIQGS